MTVSPRQGRSLRLHVNATEFRRPSDPAAARSTTSMIDDLSDHADRIGGDADAVLSFTPRFPAGARPSSVRSLMRLRSNSESPYMLPSGPRTITKGAVCSKVLNWKTSALLRK